MDELAFGGSADGRVAGLPGDAIEIEAEQGSVQAQACRGDGRLTSGMAATDHDHIEGFRGGGGEAHAFIIRRRCLVSRCFVGARCIAVHSVGRNGCGW